MTSMSIPSINILPATKHHPVLSFGRKMSAQEQNPIQATSKISDIKHFASRYTFLPMDCSMISVHNMFSLLGNPKEALNIRDALQKLCHLTDRGEYVLNPKQWAKNKSAIQKIHATFVSDVDAGKSYSDYLTSSYPDEKGQFHKDKEHKNLSTLGRALFLSECGVNLSLILDVDTPQKMETLFQAMDQGKVISIVDNSALSYALFPEKFKKILAKPVKARGHTYLLSKNKEQKGYILSDNNFDHPIPVSKETLKAHFSKPFQQDETRSAWILSGKPSIPSLLKSG